MPFKDPEDKKRWKEQWKARTRDSGYNKWLYARRKLRLDDADVFRAALDQIAQGPYPVEGGIYPTASAIARAALEESQRRWDEVGPPPSTIIDGQYENGQKAVLPDQSVQGDTLIQALAKLGLT